MLEQSIEEEIENKSEQIEFSVACCAVTIFRYLIVSDIKQKIVLQIHHREFVFFADLCYELCSSIERHDSFVDSIHRDTALDPIDAK